MHNVVSLLLHFIFSVYKSVQDWILFSYAWLNFPDLCFRLSAEKDQVTRQHKKTSVPKRKGRKRNENKRERYTNWQKIKTASSEPSQPTIQQILYITLSHNPTLSANNSFPQSNTFSAQLFCTFRHNPFPSPSFPGPWFQRAAREQRQWPPDTLHHTEKWPGRLTLSTAPVTTKHGTLSCTHSLTHCIGSAPVTSKHGTLSSTQSLTHRIRSTNGSFHDTNISPV